MNLANCNQVESLSRRGILALQAPAGTRIRSQAGSVWITQDGDPNDWVLKPGEVASFETVDAETKEIEGARVSVATPLALYRLKKGTARPKDHQDAAALRERFNLKDAEG